MNNMFMDLYISENRQQPRNISRSINEIDPNTIYPFMCQTIIGSRKPCRVLTKKWSELKPNSATGGTTSTIDSSFTNRQRYSHYSNNTQKYSSNVTTYRAPQINNLQGIESYANTITLYFTANVNSYTIYNIVVTDISENIVVHNNTFKNTNVYSVHRLTPSTNYHISITATDYLGQQTTITLDKSTTAIPFDTPCIVTEPPYIPDQFINGVYNSFGGGN